MSYQISILNPSCDERWAPFVQSHPFGWLCHTAAWKEILEEAFQHITPTYLGLIDTASNEIIAALPLCQVRSWITGNRLVSLPFATLCDPLVKSAEEFRILLDKALELSRKLGCKHLEIRAFQGESLVLDDRLSLSRHYKHHYLELDKQLPELMKSFRTSIRQGIRRAERSNLQVEEGKDEKDLREFYHLYLKTRKRLLLPPQPYRFIVKMWEKLYPFGRLTLLLARKKVHPDKEYP